MRYLLILTTLLFTLKLFAITGPELTDFKNQFESEYRVLEADSDMRAGGELSIKSDGTNITMEFSTLDTSGPITTLDVIFPIKDTKLSINNKKYTLDYSAPKLIHYLVSFQALSTDYIQIDWSKCNENGCAVGSLKVSKGGAKGVKVDTKDFFKKIRQKYIIDYAGSLPPKDPGKEFLVVDIANDPNEAVIEAPFCPPGSAFCDLGFNYFTYTDTEVYKDEISPTETLYIILVKENPLKVFHWEERSTKVVFRNYQYLLSKKKVCLEHIATK